MSTVLSYGYIKPATGDKGAVFFPALEADIQQLNDHTHDGATSAKLTSTSITPNSQTILAAAWSATSGGTYRQLVTCPPAITYDDYGIQIKLSAAGVVGHTISPTIERVSATSFYVYTNDNTVDMKVFYLV